MKEQYVNNINTHKEVLNALPKNNEKNIKAYQQFCNKKSQRKENEIFVIPKIYTTI